MKKVLRQMFYKFPRFVGSPNQKKVYNEFELEQFMAIYSGVRPCFTSVYSYFQNKPVVDKVFFDIDSCNPQTALEAGQKKFEYLTELGLPCVPVWSGMKGIHIYPLFKPKIYLNPSNMLKKFSYLTIKESETYTLDEEDGKKIPIADTHVIGDSRRLCRFPNTQRASAQGQPLQRYCIMLDPERFMDMDVEEVLDIAKRPQVFKDIKLGEPKNTLDDFDYRDVDPFEFKASFNAEESGVAQLNLGALTKVETKSSNIIFLKRILIRPCIREFILTNNPPQEIRTAAVIDLLIANVQPENIIKLLGSIGWHDWNEEITRYHVMKLAGKQLNPVGKKTLKLLGVCLNENMTCQSCILKESKKKV